ncbi:hypothetical protein [Dyella acidiphila]|uniref:DUF2868 domain-containing protein n=1 Tax=Dyella acidiphila TaxID=2775866 RepID=A0ABR9G7W6_9GAMM|nr:hypothetical protein [Dyella acidiphila]MBE1160104.1 hypothetical protein [Dyella acidiphila]
MNQPPNPPVDEREWSLQEQALRAERLGLDPSADVELQRYRGVMRALREPLDMELPANFAAQIAKRARQRTSLNTRLELWLSNALLGSMGVLLLGVVITYGGTWLKLTQAAMTAYGLMSPWLLALVIGMVLPALLGKLSVAAPRLPRQPPSH